ncbi:uncharacterized protein LOC122084190 [Macadamia integrifolia]|uniref:uncharacterized protein LOC122084190 n=1 Tax=Macadamia integrifolia TaxID=60698 RepID=UPI001C4EA983|nr:uncharacterized protein LOC122084190 [Macadamia integrifolia]
MTRNKQRKGKRPGKEREQQEQREEEIEKEEPNKRQRRATYSYVDEEIFWGPNPSRNSVLKAVDPWLRSYRSNCNCGEYISRLQNSVNEMGSSSQPPEPTSVPPNFNEGPKNQSSLSPSLNSQDTSVLNNWNMVPPSLPMMGTSSSQQQLPLLRPMQGQTPLGNQPMNSPNMVSYSATTIGASGPVMGTSSVEKVPLLCQMHGQIPPGYQPMNEPNIVSSSEIPMGASVAVMRTSSPQQMPLLQPMHGQIPLDHEPISSPNIVSSSSTTMGAPPKKQLQGEINHEKWLPMHQQLEATSCKFLKQIDLGGEVPTIPHFQEMNARISNNQNLGEGGALPNTRFKSSIYDPAYEGLGLPIDPILRHFELRHKLDNYINSSGYSQVDQTQVSPTLNQGRTSSTEVVEPYYDQGLSQSLMALLQNQDPPEVEPSINGVALLQNNHPSELELPTKGVVPFQSQNAQIFNDEMTLLN